MTSEKTRAYQKAWKRDNPEKVRAYRRAWEEANPGRTEAWREANPDYHRNYYEANRDKLLQQHRQRSRDRRSKRRTEWFAANGPCRRCGSWDDLEVDHIDPSTKVPGDLWSRPKDRMEAELAGCQALCQTCHREKSAAEKARGTAVGSAKLTMEKAEEVRRRHSEGDSQAVIARSLGVSAAAIGKIVRGETWRRALPNENNKGRE